MMDWPSWLNIGGDLVSSMKNCNVFDAAFLMEFSLKLSIIIFKKGCWFFVVEGKAHKSVDSSFVRW